MRLDAQRLHDRRANASRCRATRAELLARAARRAGAGAAARSPNIAGVPLAGGLVGYAAYDVVRYFERLPTHRAPLPDAPPLLHYVAPQSLLVFDHLTRGIALLHAGSEAERAALRREVIAALRGPMPPRAAARGSYRAPVAGAVRATSTWPACGARRNTSPPATSTSWCCRRASRAGTTLDPFQAYRALRLINPSPYMFFCELGDLHVVGSSPEALVKLQRGARASCGRSPARGRAATTPTTTWRASASCSPIRRKTPST